MIILSRTLIIIKVYDYIWLQASPLPLPGVCATVVLAEVVDLVAGDVELT